MTNGVALHSFLFLVLKLHILVYVICKHLIFSIQICQASYQMGDFTDTGINVTHLQTDENQNTLWGC